MGRADVYSQPEAPDPVLPAGVVLELSRCHLPDGFRLDGTVEVDESGGEARVYLLGVRGSGPGRGDDGIVVKTQRPHRLRPRTSLAKEAALLTALAGPLSGRIPRVFGYDRVDTEGGPVEFIVMSRIPGQAVARSAVPSRARRELLREMAAVLRIVHSLHVGGSGAAELLPVDEGSDGLRARLEANFADLVDHLAGRPDRWPLTVPPDRVAERALAALPRELAQPPVVLHSNPGPTHAFTDPGGALTGLIDFGDAYASHPALDLKSWPDPGDRLTLRALPAGVSPGHRVGRSLDHGDDLRRPGRAGRPHALRPAGRSRPGRAARTGVSRGAMNADQPRQAAAPSLWRGIRPYARQVAGLLSVAGGRVVEQGHPASLLSTESWFADLAAL